MSMPIHWRIIGVLYLLSPILLAAGLLWLAFWWSLALGVVLAIPLAYLVGRYVYDAWHWEN